MNTVLLVAFLGVVAAAMLMWIWFGVRADPQRHARRAARRRGSLD